MTGSGRGAGGGPRLGEPAASPAAVAFDAVVLAGGGGRRLGGVDKPALVVGERSLLDTVLLACAAASRTVVVGPERPTSRPVQWAREEPTGGGPAAALGAGLAGVTEATVVLLAADLPFITVDSVALLLASVEGDGALLVDDGGRDQLLCSAWRTTALRSALAGQRLAGGALRSVLAPLSAARVSVPTIEGRAAPWTDCDTPGELSRARGHAWVCGPGVKGNA